MNDTRLNIGIIGSGFIARTHAHSITRFLKCAHLAGIAGGTHAAQLAHDFSVRCYDSPEALAASKEVDAVIIATPHHLHCTHALLAADNGKHTLVEKPMATTVKDCQAIVQAFQKCNLKLMVAFTQRYRTTNRMAQEIIQSGKIGSVLMVQEQALAANGLRGYPTWQQTKENLGILFGYGIHNIDKLRWFLDDEPALISAQVNRSREGIETSTMATIRWNKGALSNLWSSVDIPVPGFEKTAYRSLIVGECGLLDVDGYGALRFSQNGNAWQTLNIQAPIDWTGDGMFSEVRMASFNAQNQVFVDSILNKTDPPISGIDGLRAVEIVLAIYRAAESKTSLTINSLGD